MPEVKGQDRHQDSEPDALIEPAANLGRDQASGSNGKPTSSRVPLPKPIRQHVNRLASDFRREHGLQDRRTGDRIARLFRASITPRRRPGRPTSPEVLQAAELRRKGIPWAKVFPKVIPDYWDLPYEKQYYRRDKLRRAVAAYFRRRRTKPISSGREKDLSSVRSRSDIA